MVVADLFVGEITTELLKQLLLISRKSASCRSSAKHLIEYMDQLLPIIQEIKLSGKELPQFRQRQLDDFSQTLSSGLELANQVLSSSRWNVYRNVRLAKKMDKLEDSVSRFLSCMQAHVMADVHDMSIRMDVRFDGLEGRLGAMKIGADGDGGLLGAAVKRMEEEERWCVGNFENLGGFGLDVGKLKVKEMLMDEGSRVIGIHGIGGSGKTTLAREISKDDQINKHFNNRVLFLTISQSPNVEQLRGRISQKLFSVNSTADGALMIPRVNLPYNAGSNARALVVLDDVWSQSVLEQLAMNIPGCKFLVVSRLDFPTSVVNCSYKLDLLSDDEAMSFFCHFAFGQATVPTFGIDEQLIKQVVDECKGLPLALKVIGASLRGQSEMFWTSAKNRLSRGQPLGESHEVQLLERMKLSIDYLSEKERECFLDMGAFPEDKKIPLDVLINVWLELHDIDETEAFAVLVELSKKNLLTLVTDKRSGEKYSSYFEISVCQHDVLRDLAIHLSNDGDSNQRKRLIMPRREAGLPKDWERNADKPFNARIISLHTGDMTEMDWYHMDCPKTEVVVLNFSSDEYFLPSFLDRMPKLRALILINYGSPSAVLHNTSVFSRLTNLRSLLFEKISLPLLPDTTTPMKNLQKVSLVLCDIRNNNDHSVANLPILFPRLSELTLDHCINLTGLPSTITQMPALRNLSITVCESLQELPSDLGKLSSIQILRLYACPNLRRLPSGVGELVNLKYLDVSECVKLEGLPEGLGGCAKLEKIDMRDCTRIKNLPVSAGQLWSLRRVICEEEVACLWQEVSKGVPGLSVHVPDQCFTLDWLTD